MTARSASLSLRSEQTPFNRRILAFQALHEDARRVLRLGVDRAPDRRGRGDGFIRKARNGALRHGKAAREVGLRDGAPGKGLARFGLLMRRETRRTAHKLPARLCAFTAFAGARADQLALELRKAAENGQNQSTMRRGRIRPLVAERAEGCAALAERVDYLEKLARRARDLVETGDDKSVASDDHRQKFGKLRTIGARATDSVAENSLAAGRPQRFELSVERLAVS